MAKGEMPEESELSGTIDDGSGEVNCLLLEPIAVKKNNMKKVIVDGGYHSLEDVYLNVRETGEKG